MESLNEVACRYSEQKNKPVLIVLYVNYDKEVTAPCSSRVIEETPWRQPLFNETLWL